MFALAWLLLPDLPEYRTGLIIVGLARCIAMVIIWNDLACGDREAAAVLVALNSVFQVLAFGAARLVLPLGAARLARPGAGRPSTSRRGSIAKSRADLPRHPAARRLPHPPPRRDAPRAATGTSRRSCPGSARAALYGLLFTIVILFALQGDTDHHPAPRRRPHRAAAAGLLRAHVGRLARCSARALGLGYERTTTLAFTAAGNNFELAIAVAIGTFGVTSGQALAGVVGPLIEVPVLVALVYVSLALRRRFARRMPACPRRSGDAQTGRCCSSASRTAASPRWRPG